MKKLLTVVMVLIIVGICIPTVSADEILYDEDLVQYIDTSGGGNAVFNVGLVQGRDTKYLHFTAIENYPDLSYIIADMPGDRFPNLESGENNFTYVLNGSTYTGRVYKYQYTNLLGQVTTTRLLMFFDDWDIGGLSGPIDVSLSFGSGFVDSKTFTSATSPIYIKSSAGSYGPAFVIEYTIASSIPWKNHIQIIEESQVPGYNINLERTILGDLYTSTINCTLDNEVVFTNTGHGTNVNVWFPKPDINTVIVTNPHGTEYIYVLSEQEPGEPGEPSSITVYVQNSQNGALIANSHIDISAFVNGEFHEVVNETLPGGIYTGNLQPTGGGLPNPDYYRLIATAEGYNSIMPYIDFEHGSDTTIYAILDPVGGAPEDENNTFIDFYVRDLNANPIAGATVNFGGYTLYTNSAGYTIFEVEKDKTYTWSVSKLGYGSVTGNAVIGSDARHTINAVIALEVTPTTPTPIPSGTPIKPTPTLTAPSGEPVNNWLEWFAAHFGMILGGGVEIGKIFMWLCFTVPVGVYVGNKAKAGAAGFMAGAGIVTLFFVLIGWVPIWLVVLIALIIGLLYAKVYSNTDNGGGR
jgi:hypothetical protein